MDGTDGESFRQRAKALMRRRFRSHRKALPSSAVEERSRALADRLLALDVMADARAVALFWPITRHKEVDLRPVDVALRDRGARVAYPAVLDQPEGSLEPRQMVFREVADPAIMVEVELGFRAPPSDAPILDALDVVIVPGLAFDDRGHRIGYGGGFYDRALPGLCPPAVSIGVAFDFQLAADVPDSERDIPVQMVVTDRRVLNPT